MWSSSWNDGWWSIHVWSRQDVLRMVYWTHLTQFDNEHERTVRIRVARFAFFNVLLALNVAQIKQGSGFTARILKMEFSSGWLFHHGLGGVAPSNNLEIALYTTSFETSNNEQLHSETWTTVEQHAQTSRFQFNCHTRQVKEKSYCQSGTYRFIQHGISNEKRSKKHSGCILVSSSVKRRYED